MGLTFVDGVVRGPSGREAAVRFLVDSGATYSLLPTRVWEDIGLEPLREMTFTLADGTALRRRIGECSLSLPHGAFHTPVILGEAGDEALLGAVTLEIFGLVLHPFSRTLEPMRAMLARFDAESART